MHLYTPVGSFYNNGLCNFVLWAPLKKKVELVTDLPEQNVIALSKNDSGYWQTTVQNAKPGLRYKYRLDGELERPDPASNSQPDGVHEASEVIDRSFVWTDANWKGLGLENMIIYELHVGAFSNEHTFEGIINKLDYLIDLGINTIELMPVGQFAGSRNWGYDGVYCYAAQNSYGGANGLKKLVNAAHKKGIAILLDVVYNHLGPEGGYLKDFGPYFTKKHKTPWGNALNFDDAYCDGVRNFFLQNALMWLDEFHIDGLRMDAVHAIVDYSAKHFMQLLKEHVHEVEKNTGKTKLLIAELDLNNPRYITPENLGGYGLQGQWNDEFHHALHALLTGEIDGYYEDFGGLKHLEKAFRDTYVYDGGYSTHRKRMFGASAANNSYGQFVVFSQNHDQIGNRVLGDRLANSITFEEQKLAAATVLLSPYTPLLFMGEEYGEKNPFLYFTSHGDDELIKNVTEGRKQEFAHFNFKEEFPDPQALDTFEQSMPLFDLQNEKHSVLFGFYKQLINLRKSLPALQLKDRDSMIVYPANGEKILTIERKNGTEKLLIVFNFNKENSSYTLPEHIAVERVFDSSSKEWEGAGSITPHFLHASEEFELNPSCVVIFKPTKSL